MSKNKSSINYNTFYDWVTTGYLSKNAIIRSKKRVVETNEIFTSLNIVLYGLELQYSSEVFLNYDISFSDNCAGEGAWLIGIALKRMQAGIPHEKAIQNLYGVEYLYDTAAVAKKRLLCGREDLCHIVDKNIVCADALRYHFRFDGSPPYDKETKAAKKQENIASLFG